MGYTHIGTFSILGNRQPVGVPGLASRTPLPGPCGSAIETRFSEDPRPLQAISPSDHLQRSGVHSHVARAWRWGSRGRHTPDGGVVAAAWRSGEAIYGFSPMPWG